MTIKLPYQNTTNKLIFDYFNTCSQQLSNVNFATEQDSKEAKDSNKIYVVITESDEIYLFCSLSCKNKQTNKYQPIDNIWAKLEGTQTEDKETDKMLVYLFDLKKFFSVMSFATNYKDRDLIELKASAETKGLTYSISKTISVNIASQISPESHMYASIVKQFNLDMVCGLDESKEPDAYTDVMQIRNVDKNSFLLPYFNHKECLNFAVNSTNCNAYIYGANDGYNYFVTENWRDHEQDFGITISVLQYRAQNLLRKDRFSIFNIENNKIDVSTGLWLMLVVLQGSKIWSKANVYINHAEVQFKDITVYHFFDRKARYSYNTQNLNFLSEFKYVGRLKADEVFVLNKLFSNSKNSYFDFSRQKFIGYGYQFAESKVDQTDEQEDKNKAKTEIDFACQTDSELPLQISFMELKHYIGTDLSQKTFLLDFFTDGIDVVIIKLNGETDVTESMIFFNHNMSKSYLGC